MIEKPHTRQSSGQADRIRCLPVVILSMARAVSQSHAIIEWSLAIVVAVCGEIDLLGSLMPKAWLTSSFLWSELLSIELREVIEGVMVRGDFFYPLDAGGAARACPSADLVQPLIF